MSREHIKRSKNKGTGSHSDQRNHMLSHDYLERTNPTMCSHSLSLLVWWRFIILNACQTRGVYPMAQLWLFRRWRWCCFQEGNQLVNFTAKITRIHMGIGIEVEILLGIWGSLWSELEILFSVLGCTGFHYRIFYFLGSMTRTIFIGSLSSTESGHLMIQNKFVLLYPCTALSLGGLWD